MNWASTAILSAAILGITGIIDSHLLSRRMPSLRAFLMPIGIFFLIYGLLLLHLFPFPEGTGIWPVLAALASGILRAIAVSIMLYTLKTEDVSRVTPVVHTSPIFVAIMAIPLLGETLYYLQWLAIIIVVAGAIMISTEKSPSGSASRLSKPFLLLFVSSLLFAVANIATKYSMAYISFWNSYSLTALCMSGILSLITIRPCVLRQLRDMKRRNSAIALLVLDDTLAMAGMVLSFWAIEKGPVSLVSTILSTRPIFVAIYVIIISRIAPKFIIRSGDKGMLALRLAATVMIVGGISIIYLT